MYLEFGKPTLDLSPVFNKYYQSHLRHIRPGGYIDPEVLHDGFDDIIANYNNTTFFAEFKDTTFEEEQEWRLIIQMSPQNKDVFFDPSGPYIVPRVALTSSVDHGLADAITEIMCGPAVEYERAKASIDMLLTQANMQKKVRVSKTAGSYRLR